jgi:hypothetical protein
VEEIGDFLEKLGMPEYGECFAQNKIDLSVLPHLTDQDLKDIGVPLGHRRKMLAAIRELPGDMGDGILVYFGYPQAHEDDAERAVRAGLELIAAVSALKAASPLQTRVGIATGLVVVGDLIGSGAAQEQAVVGETPNLAARLQGIAEPNTLVIAESTRKLLGNLFELEDLGPKDLKGIAGRANAWAALRASPVESRFEALHGAGLTALVGREEELELLLRRWSRAKSGEGQVVLLSGEAGIGKSRLTAALPEHLAISPRSHAPNEVGLSHSMGMAARAPWIKSLRRYLLPRLLIPTRRGLPPVVTCRGTKPSQAARSRLRAKLSPWPMAAISAVAFNTPTPGMVIRRRAVSSLRVHSANSLSNTAMRRSNSHHCALMSSISMRIL